MIIIFTWLQVLVSSWLGEAFCKLFSLDEISFQLLLALKAVVLEVSFSEPFGLKVAEAFQLAQEFLDNLIRLRVLKIFAIA